MFTSREQCGYLVKIVTVYNFFAELQFKRSELSFQTSHVFFNHAPNTQQAVLLVALFQVLQTCLVNHQKPFLPLLLDHTDVFTGLLLWLINGSSWVYKALEFQNSKTWTGPCVMQASNIPPPCPPCSASLCLPSRS